MQHTVGRWQAASCRTACPHANKQLRLHRNVHCSSTRSSDVLCSFSDQKPPWQQLASVCFNICTAVLVAFTPVNAAEARQHLTNDERETVQMFKKNVASVCFIVSLQNRRDVYTIDQLEIPQGAGSGIIFDTSGIVLTNWHVIKGAADLQVTLSGGIEYPVEVIGIDADRDIAVLRLVPDEGQQLPPLNPVRLGSSSDLEVGQRVFAIGNPYGLQATLTSGLISGTGREISSSNGRPIQNAIQTDASINPGNSGGPLLDSGGDVIGINTAIYSPSGGSAGVGFAIPIDLVKSSVEQILQFGKVLRPVLGISFAPDQSSEQLGVQGILVLDARPGGPAGRAGIKGTSRDRYGRLVLGDVITAVNRKPVKTASDLYKQLDRSEIGEELDLEIIRGNDKEHVNVTLESSDSLMTILPPKPRKAKPKRSLPPQEPQPVQKQHSDRGCTLLDENSDDAEVLPAQINCI